MEKRGRKKRGSLFWQKIAGVVGLVTGELHTCQSMRIIFFSSNMQDNFCFFFFITWMHCDGRIELNTPRSAKFQCQKIWKKKKKCLRECQREKKWLIDWLAFVWTFSHFVNYGAEITSPWSVITMGIAVSSCLHEPESEVVPTHTVRRVFYGIIINLQSILNIYSFH